MNDVQSRALNAAVAGQTYMDIQANKLIWNGQLAVSSKKTELDNCIIKIGQIDDAINDIGGNGTTKSKAKDFAAKTAWVIAKSLVAFAEDTNDDVLKDEIDFSHTALRHVKDATAIDRWSVVYNRAQANITALTTGGYGVDAALQATFLSQRNTFATWRGKPQAAIADIKALTIDLDKEFKKLAKIVESVKTRLVQFVLTKVNFYNGAIDAFEIDMTNIRHQALFVAIEDEDTGIRLPKAKVKILENNLEKVSSDRGVVIVPQADLEQGNYSIESSMPNYNLKNIGNVAVEKGKLTRLVIKLKKL